MVHDTYDTHDTHKMVGHICYTVGKEKHTLTNKEVTFLSHWIYILWHAVRVHTYSENSIQLEPPFAYNCCADPAAYYE